MIPHPGPQRVAKGIFAPGPDFYIKPFEKKKNMIVFKKPPIPPANRGAYPYPLVYPGLDFPLCSAATTTLGQIRNYLLLILISTIPSK